MTNGSRDPEAERIRAQHMRLGWWSLLVFLCLGLSLEALHGFKLPLYLDVSNDTRRLLWTLAHAHGALLSVVHVVFGLSIPAMIGWQDSTRSLASRCLTSALILMPLGFFLGGVFIHEGDPGLGVLLVAPGGLLLAIAVFLTARGVR
jgi:hypothetical protein